MILLCLYVGTEIILMLLNRRALLAAPQDQLTALSRLGSTPITAPVTIGVLLALVGLLLLIGALTQGRRARHQLPSGRAAVLVDNEVIASALARHAAHAGNVHPDNTVVSVSARHAIVRLTPTSGTPVQRGAVERAVQEQLTGLELYPPIRASVVINAKGRVGR
ncbi:hypothetical protein D7I44_06050 [Gryllotalpicola protaetiae]|uniref:Alkaline shock response membrane anchor protein AmaP n=1 Tax=Gryllotalpicola protaetiae TaxID=2419771 RepID=A0A387BGU3_9MICO|nr:hypothetical protein D7I44_06050 [Gryllotalpicola protaetiae]